MFVLLLLRQLLEPHTVLAPSVRCKVDSGWSIRDQIEVAHS